MSRASWGLVVFGLLMMGCGGGSGGGDGVGDAGVTPDAATEPEPDASGSAAEMIGEEGGMIETETGVSVEVPPGAVDEDTEITVTATMQEAPDEYGGVGTVVEFGPPGTVFAKPITISLPMPEGVSEGAVYWSKLGEPGYDSIGGTIADGVITAEVVHFSTGFVGEDTGTRTVSGSEMVTWVTPAGIDNVAEDLSSADIGALVPDGAGGYTEITGAGTAEGTFSIPDVPEGFYWLRVGTRYTYTDATIIDSGYARLGRQNRTAFTMPTDLVLDVTNLSSWQAGDDLEMFSPEADNWWFNIEDMASAGSPQVGASELSGFTIQASQVYGSPTSIIDGAQGDSFLVAQLVARETAEGVPYKAMARVFEPEPFTMVDGQTTMLSGAFEDVATANTISVDFRASEFSSVEPSEGSIVYPPSFYVIGQPGGLDYGSFSASADFLLLESPDGSDVTATDMSFGTPLKGAWGVLGAASGRTVYRTYTAPGATRPRYLGSGSRHDAALADFAGKPIGPGVTFVQSPTVGGLDLLADQSGVGTSPEIAWTAPATGTPDLYTVRVIKLSAAGDATQLEVVAIFVTPDTTLKAPITLFEAGQTYVIEVRATATELAEPLATPRRQALPVAQSWITSGLITP